MQRLFLDMEAVWLSKNHVCSFQGRANGATGSRTAELQLAEMLQCLAPLCELLVRLLPAGDTGFQLLLEQMVDADEAPVPADGDDGSLPLPALVAALVTALLTAVDGPDAGAGGHRVAAAAAPLLRFVAGVADFACFGDELRARQLPSLLTRLAAQQCVGRLGAADVDAGADSLRQIASALGRGHAG